MLYEVIINRNNISLTVEKVIVDAETEHEANKKALGGEFLEMDIIEVSDISELSSEIESTNPIQEEQ